MSRLGPCAGIAIGPILFVIGLIGILAAFFAASTGGFGTAGIADRVTADVVSQANLIRSKITECNTLYGTDNNGDGWPVSAAVADLECIGDPSGQKNLWTGLRPLMFPPPTSGFNAWAYHNGGSGGGRCIYTSPTGGKSASIAEGLTKAQAKFSSAEVTYDATSSSQKFIVFVTVPTVAPDDECKIL